MKTGLFFTIFFILWIGPIIAGVIVAKKKNRSPHWFWLGIWPGIGLWVFIIMLILKPLEICESCNKTIPNGAKVCPYCGKETMLASKTTEEIKKIKKRENKKIIITVFTVLLIIFILVAGIFIFVGMAFKNSEPFKHSIELIENNSEIMEYIGNDYKQTGMILGSINVSGDSTGNASIMYKIKGKNGISRIYVKAEKENGIWIYQKILFYKELGSTDVIDLLEEK
ncbi:hypothetical protein E4N87_07145 [Treponema denticola]|uniref:Zinc-ribbon domain-containing protein n=1 Tax=Treponema denticola TaxID=158 RepID=A0A9Q9EYS9_TREDN|nr:cytochrome c oxidase assembly factor Coa1 family protein [Treponema denticola]UTC90478.1 hypothetical protein E4N87_07145 [Treponema denticola]UTD00170.1 hypothetical protein E4N86_05430 [Treponema denticola]